MSHRKSYTRRVFIRRPNAAFLALIVVVCLSGIAYPQTVNGSGGGPADPGPRSGPPAAGGAISGLGSDLINLFNQSQGTFQEVDDIAEGLGPRFNADSCAACHAFPAVGGSSPSTNPQIRFANPRNALPPFVRANGPVVEARFIRNGNGSPDGGVHALFTIDGRPNKPAGCSLTQEDFSNASNISLRIPTPVFGLGLIEAVPDSVLVNNLAANPNLKSAFGIAGRLNRNGNDGTVTRFGWKAQNKSLTIFAGEAYNVEQGITNLLFPNERDDTPGCSPDASPSDSVHLSSSGNMDLLDDAFSRAPRYSRRSAAAFATAPTCRPVPVRSARPSATRPSIPSPTSHCTTWAPVSPTRSVRDWPTETSSALRRCGVSASGSSSSTTAAPKT
jgi:hypothetical protein